jgi:hypothetical protein
MRRHGLTIVSAELQMNGQHQDQIWAYTIDSDDFSYSGEYRLPPTPTLAQISLAGTYEFDDQSHVDIGFTSCDYIDGDGVQRTDTFKDIDWMDAPRVFGRNNLVRAAWEIRVSNLAAIAILNFFFWDSVS